MLVQRTLLSRLEPPTLISTHDEQASGGAAAPTLPPPHRAQFPGCFMNEHVHRVVRRSTPTRLERAAAACPLLSSSRAGPVAAQSTT